MWRLLWAWLPLLGFTHALTDKEESKFYNGAGLHSGGGIYTFTASGVPDHETADFPTHYNPNNITEQHYSYKLPVNPQLMTEGVGCLPMGIIGFTRNGVALFNPYTAEGYNAVEGENAEQFDLCDGHPTNRGTYHYHKRPLSCVVPSLLALEPDESEVFMGIALDGFPIYTTTSGDQIGLDVCNGKSVDGAYRYYATTEFPYLAGCYRGEVVDSAAINRRAPPGSANCYYADIKSPDGFNDLRAGIINDAIDPNLLNFNNGASMKHGITVSLFLALISILYIVS